MPARNGNDPIPDDLGLSWEHYRADTPRVEPLDHAELPPHPTEDVRTDYLAHLLVPESFYSIAQLNQQDEQQRADVKRKWEGVPPPPAPPDDPPGYTMGSAGYEYGKRATELPLRRQWPSDVKRPEPSVGYSLQGDSVDIAWWRIYAGVWIVIDVVLIVVWVVGWFTRMRF